MGDGQISILDKKPLSVSDLRQLKQASVSQSGSRYQVDAQRIAENNFRFIENRTNDLMSDGISNPISLLYDIEQATFVKDLPISSINEIKEIIKRQKEFIEHIPEMQTTIKFKHEIKEEMSTELLSDLKYILTVKDMGKKNTIQSLNERMQLREEKARNSSTKRDKAINEDIAYTLKAIKQLIEESFNDSLNHAYLLQSHLKNYISNIEKNQILPIEYPHPAMISELELFHGKSSNKGEYYTSSWVQQ